MLFIAMQLPAVCYACLSSFLPDTTFLLGPVKSAVGPLDLGTLLGSFSWSFLLR